MAHIAASRMAQHGRRAGQQGQQHPLGIYFKIWGLLFVLSAAPTWSTTSTSRACCDGR